MMHDEEPKCKAHNEDEKVGDAFEEVSGDVVEHDADLPTQPWVPAQENDHFQKGKDDPKGRYPLDHILQMLEEQGQAGQDDDRQLDPVF